MPETLTELRQKDDVREALAQTGGKPKIKAQATDKFWFITHALVLLGCAAVYLLLGLKWIPLPQMHLDLLQRATRATVFIVVVLAIAKAVSVYAIGRISDASTTFTLRRILHLVVGILIVLIGLSIFFANWYTALISVGVVSIIVGLSVQTPMSSFIGWIYILVRRPYRVGDRIKIGDATGDVIDVSYIDTTLWEFGG
jgi:small-conductance mechanosensitive channel